MPSIRRDITYRVIFALPFAAAGLAQKKACDEFCFDLCSVECMSARNEIFHPEFTSQILDYLEVA